MIAAAIAGVDHGHVRVCQRGQRGGGDRSEVFRATMRADRSDRLMLESDLRKAIERNELRVLFLPVVRLEDPPRSPRSVAPPGERDAAELELAVEGMTCASCAARIERRLERLGEDRSVRRVEGEQVHALTTPLLTDASGEKFGKSLGNSVWLDPAMTSP